MENRVCPGCDAKQGELPFNSIVYHAKSLLIFKNNHAKIKMSPKDMFDIIMRCCSKMNIKLSAQEKDRLYNELVDVYKRKVTKELEDTTRKVHSSKKRSNRARNKTHGSQPAQGFKEIH